VNWFILFRGAARLRILSKNIIFLSHSLVFQIEKSHVRFRDVMHHHFPAKPHQTFSTHHPLHLFSHAEQSEFHAGKVTHYFNTKNKTR
jgi:hypothetical protein